jgi:hypothetical protein
VQIAALIAALALAAVAGAAAPSSPSPPASTATCDSVIAQTTFPYATSGYRLVLGVVSVPPAHLPNVYPTHRRPWPYFRKAGLVVRADRGPVVVSVATAWRNRVAISWGGAGGSALRIAHCSTKYELRDTDANGAPKMGNAYAGGFRLRSRSACVPLIFRVGKRSETVRFGLGRRCSAR